jgi:hypothetical protein
MYVFSRSSRGRTRDLRRTLNYLYGLGKLQSIQSFVGSIAFKTATDCDRRRDTSDYYAGGITNQSLDITDTSVRCMSNKCPLVQPARFIFKPRRQIQLKSGDSFSTLPSSLPDEYLTTTSALDLSLGYSFAALFYIVLTICEDRPNSTSTSTNTTGAEHNELQTRHAEARTG